jgi:DNA polymerase III subunit chi
VKADFYHLTDQPLERVLPRLAERVLADGGRLLVIAESERQRSHIDDLLWSYSPDSFLPHGRAGAGNDSAQPILISAGVDAVNGARTVALADGIWRDDVLAFDRALHLFDDESIGAARDAWKGLKDRPGVERCFWKREDGRWQQVG